MNPKRLIEKGELKNPFGLKYFFDKFWWTGVYWVIDMQGRDSNPHHP